MDGVVVSTMTDEGAMVRRDTNILWRCVAVTAWLSSMGCCACELPEAKVAGRAVDAETLEPLADVRIEWNGESKTTGKDGVYTFTMPVGVQELRVSHGDAQFSTLVVVGHSKWKQGLAQVQDVLVRNTVPTSRAFTLNFLGADFNDVEQDFASGLLATNVDGGGAAFLKVANHLSQLPQWDAPAKVLYFADLEANGRVFRHDTHEGVTTPVACAGFEPSGVNMLCVAPDGDTALVSTNDQNLVLRHLNGGCTSEPIGDEFVPPTPARCSFDAQGYAYVVTRRASANNLGRGVGELRALDARAPAPSLKPIAWLSDWNVNHPTILPDGQLLLERSSGPGDEQRRETLLVNLQTETFTKLSETEAPVTLVGDRLYFIANERALRVRLLSNGNEATLINAAATGCFSSQ